MYTKIIYRRKTQTASFTDNSKHFQFFTTLAAIGLGKTLPIYEINENQCKFATNTDNNFAIISVSDMNKNKMKKYMHILLWSTSGTLLSLIM